MADGTTHAPGKAAGPDPAGKSPVLPSFSQAAPPVPAGGTAMSRGPIPSSHPVLQHAPRRDGSTRPVGATTISYLLPIEGRRIEAPGRGRRRQPLISAPGARGAACSRAMDSLMGFVCSRRTLGSGGQLEPWSVAVALAFQAPGSPPAWPMPARHVTGNCEPRMA